MNPYQIDRGQLDLDHMKRRGGYRRSRSEFRLVDHGPAFLQVRHIPLEGPPQDSSRREAPNSFSGYWKRTTDYNNPKRYRTALTNLRKGVRGRHFTDGGNPFSSESVSIYTDRPVNYSGLMGRFLTEESGSGMWHARGRDVAKWMNDISNGTFTTSWRPISDPTLIREGATGIARTIPTAPEMSIAQTIGELKKDGLPSIPGSQLKNKRLSSVGSEYLNFQFGIMPLSNDVADIIRLTREYESIIKQFRRDQGRLVRRRITLRDETDHVGSGPLGFDNLYAVYRDSNGYFGSRSMGYLVDGTFSETKSEKIWLSAAYSIGYPNSLDGPLKDLQEFNRVFGVIPTPELVWELLPWSWLVDWFSNVGDIIRNVSYLGTPLTKIAYAYVMGRSQRRVTYSGNAAPNNTWVRSANPSLGRITTHLHYDYKRRLKASPFGFGLDFGGLSNHQKSILSALGLSRLKF